MSDKSVDVVLVGPNAGKDRHFFGVAFRGGRGVVPPGDSQATVLRVLREDFGAVVAPGLASEPEPTPSLVTNEDEEDDLLGGKDEDEKEEKDKSKATTKRIKRNR